jgi:[ribosomal protein S5]-alanine N-acetyltransferase
MVKNIFDIEIETERLRLRRLRISDVDDMFEYTSNPAVTNFLSWSAHTDKAQTILFIEKVMKKYDAINTEFTYGIELKSEKKLIGALKISNISIYNKRGEFTSILNPAFQGKGYMGEAWQGLLSFCFTTARLNRIQSYVTPDNVASQKKNDRAGLQLEGRLKDYWIMKGVYKDALVYAITAEIFRKNKEFGNTI